MSWAGAVVGEGGEKEGLGDLGAWEACWEGSDPQAPVRIPGEMVPTTPTARSAWW